MEVPSPSLSNGHGIVLGGRPLTVGAFNRGLLRIKEVGIVSGNRHENPVWPPRTQLELADNRCGLGILRLSGHAGTCPVRYSLRAFGAAAPRNT